MVNPGDNRYTGVGLKSNLAQISHFFWGDFSLNNHFLFMQKIKLEMFKMKFELNGLKLLQYETCNIFS